MKTSESIIQFHFNCWENKLVVQWCGGAGEMFVWKRRPTQRECGADAFFSFRCRCFLVGDTRENYTLHPSVALLFRILWRAAQNKTRLYSAEQLNCQLSFRQLITHAVRLYLMVMWEARARTPPRPFFCRNIPPLNSSVIEISHWEWAAHTASRNVFSTSTLTLLKCGKLPESWFTPDLKVVLTQFRNFI